MKPTIPELEHHQSAAADPPATGFVRWVLTHDDSRLFAVLYIGLALVLSITLGLFWLVAVVALHGVLEILRQRRLHRWWPGVLSRVLWELKLDLGLILFAFVVTLYMDVVLGMAGVNAAVRAGARGGARLLAWQRGLRAALLSVDDAAQVVRMVGRRRSPQQQADQEAGAGGLAALGVTSPFGGWAERWSGGDRFTVGFGLVCFGLILAAPWLTGEPAAAVWRLIVAELQPFP
jgi:hypothetical protein